MLFNVDRITNKVHNHLQAQSYPSLNPAPGQNNGPARQTNEAEQVRITALS